MEEYLKEMEKKGFWRRELTMSESEQEAVD